jgi:hypothetical protein
VATEQLRDLWLREPVVAIERAHQPCFFERRQLLASVALPQQELRRRTGDLVDLGAQRRPAELACADQALEAVDELDRSRVPTAHHRDQLTVA